MLNSVSFPQNNPKRIHADALTDISFLKWTSYINCSNSNLFITASYISDFIDLYEFNENGYADKNNSYVKRINRFVASARISSLSDARKGIVAFGCSSGKYGLLKVMPKSNDDNLVASGKFRSMGDTYISAVDFKDDKIFIGTQNGKLAIENIKFFDSKIILTENNAPLKAIYASSSNLCLVGHGCGLVSLWDLRSREENVLNFNIKNRYRSSYKTLGGVTACHLKNDCFAIVGTSFGNVQLMDMRYVTEKYPCVLKVSQKAITSVRFAETSSNIAFVTCFEGYAEIRNDSLASLWFSDDELDVAPWFKGNHYDKLQTSWSCQLKDLIALDTLEDQIVMGTNGGDLCFILP